jgi:glutamine synthetase
MLAKPDPSTFSILPWRTEAPGAARMFCDITMPDGSPSHSDPRNVLRRTLDKAAKMGYTCYTHPEIEFFLFKSQPEKGVAPVPVDQGGYFDHTPAVVGHDFRRQAITLLEAMGISVEFSHHEGAPGQQEIDLRYADALSTADNIMTFRHVIKEVALEQGFYASFMPKPFTDHPGSGMHTHVSLFEGENNAFYDSQAEFHLSQVGRSFVAGILKHAAEMTAITNQWVNSYKRLQGGGEAPSLINWGRSDRGALVRIPMYKPNKENSTRIEFRSPDSACNPYLAYAVMLAAGLKGIEDGYVLEEVEQAEALPANLHEAIVAMEGSELVRQTLGEHVFEFVLRNKRAEWQDYRRQVSAYELDRYLPVL